MSATILFADIVGFSKKNTANQKTLIQSFTKEIRTDIKKLLKNQGILALPTGDGMALVFLHRSRQEWDRSNILCLIYQMQEWAKRMTRNNTSVTLRIGVHIGPVEMISDINGKRNCCGDTINIAQRVMDSAAPRQVLFSDAAFRWYSGTENLELSEKPFSRRLSARFVGPIDVFAKHGLSLPVYKLALKPEQKWWSNSDPLGKNIVPIRLTPLPKEIAGSFGDRLKSASSIAFIQLTGDRFLDSYFSGKITFSKTLEKFWVLMPDPIIYSRMKITNAYASAAVIKACINKWKKLFQVLKRKHPKAQLKLGLFKEPPYFGASFVDWGKKGGIIHVSPYIWNIPAPQCPGYDLEWIGHEPSPVYAAYAKGLEYLNSMTLNKAF